MKRTPQNWALASGLILAVILFGANNTGIKFMLQSWPPLTTGAVRLFLASWIFLALLRWTPLFGGATPLDADLRRQLWTGTGLTMALYVLAFFYAVRMTPVSHVALYLGASPVWALLWEGPPERNWRSAQRYGAAALAFCGVLTLLAPALRAGGGGWFGEMLALAASVIWTNFGRQCRALSDRLSGAEISGHTFWRSGVLLTPLLAFEWPGRHYVWNWTLGGVLAYCVTGGGVAAFALWSSALRHWKTSRVLLFNNLVPLSTMTWAHFCLGEPFSRTFWAAMALIGSGVVLGVADVRRIASAFWVPWE